MPGNRCPISYIQVDENVIRIQAFYISLFAVSYLVTESITIILILFIDFLTRSLKCPEYSVLFNLSQITKKIFKISSVSVDAGPKYFANNIGLFVISLAIIFSFIHLEPLALITVSVLLSCALLESVFGFCIACKFYPIWVYISTLNKKVC
ncbi:MAG: CDP-alcohol phosphatidyltransferase [Arcobacter sp.]|nr:MAG: CDP-alcohol phosphatidyltransferase [Arcobacter sp.]